MKHTIPTLIVAAVSAALILTPSAKAATATWLQTTGTNDWSDSANWSGSTLPVAGDTVNITNSADTTTQVTFTNTPGVAGVLNLWSGVTSTFINLAGGTLTMDNLGSQAVINLQTNGTTPSQTVISGTTLEMTAGGLLINKTPNSSVNFFITGPITNTTAGANTLTVAASGEGNLTVNGGIHEGSGTLSVIVDSTSGSVPRISIDSTNNNFSGGVLIRNGNFVGSTNLGSGTITFGDSSSTLTAVMLAQSGHTITNNIIASSNTTKGIELLQGSSGNSGTLSGAIDLQKNANLHIGSGDNVSLGISGDISGSGRLGAYNDGVGDNATFTLSGSNSHTGGVLFYANHASADNAKLVLGNAYALGTGTLTIGSTSGNTHLLDSSLANLTIATTNAIIINRDIRYVGTGGNNLNLGTGAVTIGTNTTRTVTVDAGVLTFGGALGGGTNVSLTKAGTGTLALNGISTYTNTTTVSAGTLRGTGTVAGDLQVNNTATLAAGDGGIGTFTVGGAADFQNGSSFVFELNTTSQTYDLLVANGLTIGSTAAISFSDLGGTALTLGTQITLISNTSGSAISGAFNGYAEGYEFTLGPNIFKTSYIGGIGGNDLTLTAVVPEPSVVALFAAGIGLLAFMRRRRA